MGVGLIGTSAGMAAPVNATTILDALKLETPVTQAQYYYRRRHYHCWYVTKCRGYYPYQTCWKQRVCGY
jgi:hypothetical protein